MSKSEEPTARRLRRAIREGDVPYSPVLVRAAALTGTLAVLPAAVRATRSRVLGRLHEALTGTAAVTTNDVVRDVVTLAAPAMAVALALSLGIGLVQTGGIVALGRRRPGATPRRSFDFFDGRRAARAALGAIAAAAILFAATSMLKTFAPDIAHALPSAPRAAGLSASLLERFGWTATAILAAASMLDWLVERAAWQSRLRMTPREIEEERREHEGDPEIRRARRRAREALSRDSATRSTED